MTLISKNNNELREVSILEVKLKLEEILAKYDSYVISYKELTNNVLSEQFLYHRPWIVGIEDKSVTISSEYIKQNISMNDCDKLIKSINKRQAKYKFSESENNSLTEQKKRNLDIIKSIEKLLFFKNIEDATVFVNQNSIRTINNGEFMFLTKSISSNNLKIKSVEAEGNAFNRNLKIVREFSNKFLGINMTASYIDDVDGNNLPKGITFTSAMTDAAKKNAISKFESYYEDMSVLPQMLYTICTAKYLDLRDKGLLIKGVYGIITLDEIHFTYRQLSGSGGNRDSIPLHVKKQYIEGFRQLEKYRINMEFNPNKMPQYYQLKGNKKNQTTVINDQIFYIMGFVGKNGDISNKKVLSEEEYKNNLIEIEAIRFAFGEIGDIYLEQNSRRLQYNQNYPKSNLGLNPEKQKWAYRIAHEISIEHRINYDKNKTEHELKYSIQDLIQIAQPKITSRNFKRDINAFLQNQCLLAFKSLSESNLISEYTELPTLTPKDKNRLDNIIITIKLKYNGDDY